MSNTHSMRVSGLGVLIMKSKLILNHFYPRNSLWCFWVLGHVACATWCKQKSSAGKHTVSKTTGNNWQKDVSSLYISSGTCPGSVSWSFHLLVLFLLLSIKAWSCINICHGSLIPPPSNGKFKYTVTSRVTTYAGICTADAPKLFNNAYWTSAYYSVYTLLGGWDFLLVLIKKTRDLFFPHSMIYFQAKRPIWVGEALVLSFEFWLACEKLLFQNKHEDAQTWRRHLWRTTCPPTTPAALKEAEADKFLLVLVEKDFFSSLVWAHIYLNQG